MMRATLHNSSDFNAEPVKSGFALIATVMVMTLLVMVTLAALTLSSVELKRSSGSIHQEKAKANARLALMLAIGELQKHAGPDQRVTARADILEADSEAGNRNWLGVWKTTVESRGQEWPVIGKAQNNDSSDSPYSQRGAYEDLRHTKQDLSGGKWKTALHQAWLVSSRSLEADVTEKLNELDDEVVEILGKGTLGETISDRDYQQGRILVEKVNLGGSGAYAWYVSDNNQKASIDPLSQVDDVNVALEVSPRANPALVVSSSGSEAYTDFSEQALKNDGKLVSYATASLTDSGEGEVMEELKQKYHDFTVYSPGLFVDTMLSGLRRDLTPLLLTNKDEETVMFNNVAGEASALFSSELPIIPGPDHGVLGPSFAALRNWAQKSYITSNSAETTVPQSAIRMRPVEHWPHGMSDGASIDARRWAELAPKIHPIMTEVRWHYYFSHHNKRIRTHIIPRVCLWNPYNKALNTPTLTVMMPNPFYGLSSGMHFFPEVEHIEDLKAAHSEDESHVFSKWVQKGGYVGGSVYKMRLNPFPAERYLAFALEPTLLEAGECHVFSPKVVNGNIEANGVKLQEYQSTSVSSNVLSSSVSQGSDHFYYDHDVSVKYEVQATSWKSLSELELAEMNFGRIFDYQPEVVMKTDGKIENFPFILKSGSASSLVDLYSSGNYPTLQLINNGAGGVKPTTYFAYSGSTWGPAGQSPGSFGNLQTFQESPMKDAPATHQVGAKLLWLDESATEGNNAPLRVDRWTADHMAYNISPVANWNVRAQVVTRSPVSQCASKWYMTSTGPWMLQFVPFSPQDFNDQPSLNSRGTAFIKNPFGACADFSVSQRVVLFDLPSSDYGVLSMAKLRHAMISPYSWSPSYIIGHSLRDLHSPAEKTAHDVATEEYTGGIVSTRWDYLIGGSKDSGLNHGPYAKIIDSQGLLQIGNEAVSRSVNGNAFSSADEILAYDIAYEVNHNLWDRYFISGMPLREDTQAFDWDPSSKKPLWNTRYQFNFDSGKKVDEIVAELSSSGAINVAFSGNAEILKNRAAFNVNSTSVDAWVAFLSGTLGVKRSLKSGELDGELISFSRYASPLASTKTAGADPDDIGGWLGAREFSAEEIRALAANIVDEVKARGPFVSIADFVNRRLTNEEDPQSCMGVLETAIRSTALNEGFEKNSEYLSTTVNIGTNTDAPDNNLEVFQKSYRFESNGTSTTVQPTSQAWGMPGFLTQSDILEPIASSLSVRGDTFTIRAYGESIDSGVLMANAWLEVVVERIPQYVDSSEKGNVATDRALLIDQATGAYSQGNLNEVNQKFGRKFIIKSFRWLNSNEI